MTSHGRLELFFPPVHVCIHVSGDAFVGRCASRAARLSVCLPCGFPDAGAYVLKTSVMEVLWQTVLVVVCKCVG